MLTTDNLDQLLDILPDFIKNPLKKHRNRKFLIEIVMDLGRRPEARFPNGPEYLSWSLVSWYDLDFCVKRIGNFSGDNRAGIEYTLHRISSIKNRQGNIIGLTFRVGRAIFGTISIIRDILRKNDSILLLGKPGVGKTTAIREIARVLADEMDKRVVIIDTSNEIAGDGDIPHPAIGRARRMQVTHPELQHKVMIEAVENHMPEVIIIDEIGTELESCAARTIAERGVQLVGTAHGNYLESIIKNPILADLIGGVQHVTLGDEEAKRRGSQKSILERKSIPAFQVAIEIHERNNWIIHERVDYVVDQVLKGFNPCLQSRKINDDRSISILCENSSSTGFFSRHSEHHNKIGLKSNSKKIYISTAITDNKFLDKKVEKSNLLFSNTNSTKDFNSFNIFSKKNNDIHLYCYGISIQKVNAVIKACNFSILITRDIMQADIILMLKSYVINNSKVQQIAKRNRMTIYTIHSITMNNIFRALSQIVN